MTKTNNGKLKLETIDRRPVSLGSWCSKRCSLLRVRGLGTRLQLSKSSRTTLARRLATLQQFSRRVAEAPPILVREGHGHYFSFRFRGGRGGKQASKQARQGKARQANMHRTSRCATLRNSLTFHPLINPAPNGEPTQPRQPSLPGTASASGRSLRPMKMHVHVLRNQHWNQEQNENERTVRGLTQTSAGHGTAHRATHLAASRQGPSNSLRQRAWRAVGGEVSPTRLLVAQRRAEERSVEESSAEQNRAGNGNQVKSEVKAAVRRADACMPACPLPRRQ
jgi:hypothetical protein